MPEDYWVALQLENGRTHDYRYIGGPIEEPEANTAIFAAIGHAAASWARMEQHIDAILVQINKQTHSDDLINLYDEEHPRPFTDKIDLLKSYFNKHPGLEQYKEAVRDYATGLLLLAKERNEMLHGILETYEHDTQVYTINGMRFQKKTKDFLNRHQRSPINRITAFSKMVNAAHYALCKISDQLFTFEALQRLRRPG